MRFLGYFALALLALPLQSVLLPPLFPGGVKPDLVLLLTIWIGLRERPWSGGGLVYALGWLYDGYAGTYPGLHGFVLLVVFLTVCGMVTRLDTESRRLLWWLVGGCTLLQAGVTVFALEFFTSIEDFWLVVLRSLPAQLVANLLAAFLLRRIFPRVTLTLSRLAPARVLRVGRRHEN